MTSMNNTTINLNPIRDYDRNGAIIYTIVTLLFYSLSLFCSLILNIDPDDHSYGQKWSAYQNGKTKRMLQSTRVDVLNVLADQSLRQKYWRIYYGNDEYDRRSAEFTSAELKRLTTVSQRMKELNNEQMKRNSKHEELYHLNQIVANQTSQPSPDPSTTSFRLKLRRGRSTSVPFVFYPGGPSQRSYNVLSETPLSKPAYKTQRKNSTTEEENKA